MPEFFVISKPALFTIDSTQKHSQKFGLLFIGCSNAIFVKVFLNISPFCVKIIPVYISFAICKQEPYRTFEEGIFLSFDDDFFPSLIIRTIFLFARAFVFAKIAIFVKDLLGFCDFFFAPFVKF